MWLLLVLPAAWPAHAGHGPLACSADARWGLVVDAGSSGSRLHYYCWKPAPDGGLPWIEDHGSEKRVPGIADLDCTRTPAEAVDLLRPLIEHAAETIGDEKTIRSTPLSVLATGGLRQCSPDYQQSMLHAIGRYLSGTSFAPVEAAVITGQDEGRFGWLTINYLQDRLGAAAAGDATLGALDLGGASTQISFVSRECRAAREACSLLELGGAEYPLYTHSYLGWGQDEARRTVDSPACSVRGYPGDGFVGRGKFKACRRAIRRAIARELRAHPPEPPCARSCSRLGAYQPTLAGEFVAFSAFAYTSDHFGLGPSFTLEQLAAAGKAYCRRRWSEVRAECTDGGGECDVERLDRYCFSAAYIVTLLHDVYGFQMGGRRVTSTHELDGDEIDWTLGVMVQMADGLSAPR